MNMTKSSKHRECKRVRYDRSEDKFMYDFSKRSILRQTLILTHVTIQRDKITQYTCQNLQ